MIDKTMTDEELETQAARYGYTWFRTPRQAPIRIDHYLSFKLAVQQLEQAYKRKKEAHWNEAGVCGADAYRQAQEETREAEEAYYDMKAQAEAACYRELGVWPSQLRELGLR